MVTGIDSPVTIAWSSVLRAFDDVAVDRHLLAGPDAQTIADGHAVDVIVFLGPSASIRVPSWAQVEQCSDGAARLLTRCSSSTWPSSTSVTMTAAASK